jgi:bacillolysin
MKSLKNYAVFTLFLLAFSLNAQEKSKFLRDDNQEIKDLTKKVGDNGWLEFKEGNKTKHTDFFTKHKDAFGLGAKDKVDVTRENREAKTNYKHYRMQQSYGGIPIEGAEFFLHYNAKDELDVANGKLCENLTIPTTPKITADKALTSALKEFKNVVFLWQDTARENSLKRESGNILATYKPKGELVITFPENEELKSAKAILAYKFDIGVSKPNEGSWLVYVDAQTGLVSRKKDNLTNCNYVRTLTFVSLYNGNQSTTSCRHSYGFLGLGGIGNFLAMDDWNLNFSIRDNATQCEIQRNWEDWGTTDQQFTSANWALENTWTYFRDIHGRNGWDGNGKQAILFVDPLNNLPQGAFYSSTSKTMTFGKFTMSLDITGHEFTHGVVDHSAKLNGTFTSLSLNESFADIFGEMIERRTLGFTNWRILDDVPWVAIGASPFPLLRDLIDPNNSFPSQPVTFQGANWQGLGGIPESDTHINGGVQNRWFTLLANGNTALGIQGIGADAAANITYYSLTHFLGANSNFQDARDGAINSARILYGCGSNELLQTWRAWNAVGLATPMPAPFIPTNLIYQCESDQTASISPCWFQGATYSWSNISAVGGVVSGVNNNTLTYNIKTVKNATVNLSATFQGNTVNIPISIRVNKCTGGQIPIRNPNTNGNSNNPIFSISPNPTYETVNIDLKNNEDDAVYKVNIVNSVGQVMKVEALKQSQNQINLNGLANGLYNIVIYDSAGGIKQSSKIIKSPY